MMGGLASQQTEGQLTPDALGLPPEAFQDLANNPSLAASMQMPGQPRNGREG